jgi:hypothetical protein
MWKQTLYAMFGIAPRTQLFPLVEKSFTAEALGAQKELGLADRPAGALAKEACVIGKLELPVMLAQPMGNLVHNSGKERR